MKHPCEIVVRYFLPACRSLIAKELIEDHGFTQVAAAKKLGTTQAAISYYLSSKRGEKYIKQLEKNPLVKSTASEISKGLAEGILSSAEFMGKLCSLCTSLRKSDLVCRIHRNYAHLPDTCEACLIGIR